MTVQEPHLNRVRYEFDVLAAYGVLPVFGDRLNYEEGSFDWKSFQTDQQQYVVPLSTRNETVNQNGGQSNSEENRFAREKPSHTTAAAESRTAQFKSRVLKAYGLVLHWNVFHYISKKGPWSQGAFAYFIDKNQTNKHCK